MLRTRAIAAALSVLGVAFICSSRAEAAPTELTVRIEGSAKTLFEGPIETDGHPVQASSDAEQRPCDATNNGAHPEPGPTPTAAAADAMELIGEGFDGQWYPGYEDYFLQRWGPDREDAENAAYWGILVDGTFTPVGGCQFLATAGDQVLWVYDAFGSRDPLWLSARGDLGFPAATTATVGLGEPLTLTVERGEPPNTSAAAGVTVAPVATTPGKAFQEVEASSSAAVATDSEGHAAIAFSAPGWHRIKAQEEVGFIRSNRLDVCVEASAGSGCGPQPADAEVRIPPRYLDPPQEEAGSGGQAPAGGSANRGPGPALPLAAGGQSPSAGRLTIGALRLDRARGGGTLSLGLPSAGRLVVSGPGVLKRSLRATGGGRVQIVLRPSRAGRKALRKRGILRVPLTIRFTPAGGVPSLRKRVLTLRLHATR